MTPDRYPSCYKTLLTDVLDICLLKFVGCSGTGARSGALELVGDLVGNDANEGSIIKFR